MASAIGGSTSQENAYSAHTELFGLQGKPGSCG